MTVSRYFNHISYKPEQDLVNDLMVESVQQRGQDLLYIPRKESDAGFDFLFGEDPENIYTNGVTMEFYCMNYGDGFDGSDEIGRFALQMPDICKFQCSKTRFSEEVTNEYPHILRPREGDLIVFQADPEHEPKDVFEITFVEKEEIFYEMGRSQMYSIETERFNYSHETMETGNEEIDTEYVPNMEDITDSPEIQNESDTFVNFNEKDPFSDGGY